MPFNAANLLPAFSRRQWWLRLLRDGVRPLFVFFDVVACLSAAVLTQTSSWLAAAFTVLIVMLYSGAGLYRSRLALSLLDDLPKLVRVWLIAVGIWVLGPMLMFDRVLGFTMVATAGAMLLVGRALSYLAVQLLRRKGAVAHGTVIVGGDTTARDITQKLLESPRYGLAPLGFLTEPGEGMESLPAPVLGAPRDLLEILLRHNPRALIVARGALPEHDLVALVRACQRNRSEVFIIPWLHQLHHVSNDMEFVWDIPLVRLRRAAYRSTAWRLKRLFDVVVSALAIVFLAPVMAACALAVFLEGGRGVIFRQERVGCDGLLFWLMKFRSLRPVDNAESATQWNISQDHRLGRVGRILRVTSLDELPQLFNILRGDMSLVGPRPERPHFVQQFGGLYDGYSARHRVPCGLTGWAQVHGLRGNTSINDRARFDNFYIENWSLWLDLKIMLRTVISVVRAPGS